MAGIISQIAKNPQLPFDENIKKLSGFSNVEEYNRYVKKVSKFAKNKDITKLFFGIRGASNGLQLNPDGNNYFVYASRKPVNGRFQFPNFTREPITLKEYYSYFGDILMVVTSRDEVGTDHYRNRGIFKSPISFIEDGNKYPSLSMKLHGFTAAVANRFFENKQYMIVQPMKSMEQVILNMKGWQPGDVTIEGKDILNWDRKELDSFVAEELHFSISINALIRVYKR